MEMLLRYEWPGNLRELRHAMRSVTLFCEGKTVQPGHVIFHRDLAPETRSRAAAAESPATSEKMEKPANDVSLEAAILEHVRRVYEQCGRNQRGAAQLLGISRGKLARHLARLELK